MVWTLACAGLLAAACTDNDFATLSELEPELAAAAPEDGLAEAYQVFRQQLINDGQDRNFTIGFGFHEGMVTTRLPAGTVAVNGSATLFFDQGLITGTLRGVPDDQRFDLWLVKNVAAPGLTVRPEYADLAVRVGGFQPSASPGIHLLSETVAAEVVHFDLDLVVVTAAGQPPYASVIASGSRTLLEKRFFRERAGAGLDPIAGPTLDTVETSDALVARGAELFFHETFGGNGRTCGTCHPAQNNLTIDPAFIAQLPSDDPLFIAEIDPALAQLENPLLLRHDALILENVDGFDDPTRKFVLRSVPHTLAMSTSMGRGDIVVFPPDGPPPDFRTGWSGDGAPGRGSLNEFGFGAVMQHFTRSLSRQSGVDFRVPTQEELDALEAFQLFSGRQKNPQTASITFREPRAESGKNLFLGPCVACHRDVVAQSSNLMADTDIERILIAAPRDGGFGTTGTDTQGGIGTGRFNVPPLVEAADTAPYFHNNTILTLEEAIAFYATDVFFFSPSRAFTGTITLSAQDIEDIGAFLRVINAAENIRQTRKRVLFVEANRGGGNAEILAVAIADLQDAIDDLEPKALHPNAVKALRTARQTLEIAKANTDDKRPPYLQHALAWLGLARGDLFTANPLNEF